MDNNEEKKVNIEKPQQNEKPPQNTQPPPPKPQSPPQTYKPPQKYRYTSSQSTRQFTTQMGNPLQDLANDKEKLEKTGLICACAGFAISFLFTLITCSRSASISIKSGSIKDIEAISNFAMLHRFRVSYFFIIIIIGATIAIAGGIMAFMSKRGNDFTITAKITFIIVLSTLILATIPNITICAYNNSLNNATDKIIEKEKGS